MPSADEPGPEGAAPARGAVQATGPIISTSGLSRSFGDVAAVRGLDLTVGAGEMFGLVGPDGAGKSTIIRMLVGILTPGSGSGTILGRDLVKGRAALKADLGYLSQKFSLYGDLSVDENIEFFAELHRVYDYRALREELLEFTQLKPFRDRLADRLSGGMKQKLALICTLIHRPKVIFLDEPTTGVDPVSRRELWGLLQKLNSGGMTIILCTPYLDEAERCARVAFIHQGELLTVDTPENLRRTVPGRMMEIVCDNPRKAVELLAVRGEYAQSQVFGDRIRVIVEAGRSGAGPAMRAGVPPAVETIPGTGPSDPFEPIDRLLSMGGVRSGSHRFVKPSLEDVFIYLMRTPAEESDGAAAGSFGPPDVRQAHDAHDADDADDERRAPPE